MRTVTLDEIIEAARRVNPADKPMCIHASMRSFDWVAHGGKTILHAFTAASNTDSDSQIGSTNSGSTVLVPTFSWSAYAIAPPPHLRPERNGWDYGAHSSRDDTTRGMTRRTLLGMRQPRIYAPQSRAIDREMGALPAALLAQPERVRSAHPLCSFAALGPLARRLTANQRADDVFAPLRNLAAAGGLVILMGVGLNRMTLLHEAEKQAGRTLFRRWAYDENSMPAMYEVGGCSEGFEQIAPYLADHEQRITVGRSVWRIYPAQSVLDICAPLIRAQPEITRCADPRCTRCRDAILGGPVLNKDEE